MMDKYSAIIGNNILDAVSPDRDNIFPIWPKLKRSNLSYSPVRHLASAIFPFSYRHKFMMMLSAYLDETGHSKDRQSKFNGMAGLIAPAAYWETYETEWKEALNEFQIPYFHMKEFAHSVGVFKGWSKDEDKRRALYSRLMGIIESTYALPFGCIVPMEYYRQYPALEQYDFLNPYYMAFSACASIAANLISPLASSGETIAMIFSDQMEFKNFAFRLYDIVKQAHPYGNSLDSPVFRDMRKIVPLQGADIVAYELFKECERQFYRPDDKPRWAWAELQRIAGKSANFIPITIYDHQTLQRHVDVAKRVQAEFDKKKAG